MNGNSKAAAHPKKRNRISEQFSARLVSMLESPAWQVTSRPCRMFLDRLEIELAHHGGNDNGKLPLTYQDCIEYGMYRDSIAPAQREAVALGFAELTQQGRGGNADYNKPNLWRLTYIEGRDRRVPATHEWRRIKTLEEAERIARAARKDKDPKAVEDGIRRSEKQKTGPGNQDRKRKITGPGNQDYRVSPEIRTTLYSWGRGGVCG
jgi:hypothetical protein